MEKAIKMRLLVDSETARVLDSQMRITNFLYNNLLETANDLRAQYRENQDKEVGKTLYTQRGLRNLVPELKKKFPFLKTVHSSPLKNAALRLSDCIKSYQDSRKGRRKGKKTGWPRFRSHKVKPFSLLYDEPQKGFKVEGCKLKISLGQSLEGKRLYACTEMERSLVEFPGIEIKQLRIKQEQGCFYAVFSVTVPEISPKNNYNRIIAFDTNHKNLAVGVDTEGEILEIANAYFSKGIQKRIDSLRSKRDKCTKKSVPIPREDGKIVFRPSRRWTMLNERLQSVYRLRREQTKTMLYSHANHLFEIYDVVGVGDYTPKGGGINSGMRRQMNNESLIGRFKKTIEWVAKKSGKVAVIWPERNSTKQCADCKELLPKALKPDIRSWQCPHCKKHHDRDVNAARNGLQRVLSALGQEQKKLPCFGHLEFENEFSGCVVRWNGLGLDFSSRSGAVPSS